MRLGEMCRVQSGRIEAVVYKVVGTKGLTDNANHHRAAASDVSTSKDAARCSACMGLL